MFLHVELGRNFMVAARELSPPVDLQNAGDRFGIDAQVVTCHQCYCTTPPLRYKYYRHACSCGRD